MRSATGSARRSLSSSSATPRSPSARRSRSNAAKAGRIGAGPETASALSASGRGSPARTADTSPSTTSGHMTRAARRRDLARHEIATIGDAAPAIAAAVAAIGTGSTATTTAPAATPLSTHVAISTPGDTRSRPAWARRSRRPAERRCPRVRAERSRAGHRSGDTTSSNPTPSTMPTTITTQRPPPGRGARSGRHPLDGSARFARGARRSVRALRAEWRTAASTRPSRPTDRSGR